MLMFHQVCNLTFSWIALEIGLYSLESEILQLTQAMGLGVMPELLRLRSLSREKIKAAKIAKYLLATLAGLGSSTQSEILSLALPRGLWSGDTPQFNGIVRFSHLLQQLYIRFVRGLLYRPVMLLL